MLDISYFELLFVLGLGSVILGTLVALREQCGYTSWPAAMLIQLQR